MLIPFLIETQKKEGRQIDEGNGRKILKTAEIRHEKKCKTNQRYTQKERR
jgi:hypothetical protein